jgi:hypothetical protein
MLVTQPANVHRAEIFGAKVEELAHRLTIGALCGKTASVIHPTQSLELSLQVCIYHNIILLKKYGPTHCCAFCSPGGKMASRENTRSAAVPLSHSEKGNGRLRACLVEMPPHGRGRDKFLRHGMAAGPTNCGMGQKNGSGRSASRHRSRREESFAGKFMILKIVNFGFAIALCAILKAFCILLLELVQPFCFF